MNKLIEILNAIRPGVDFVNASNIIGDKLLDSLSIIQLVSKIDAEFDIEIPVTELIPQNFNTVQAMMDMISRLEEE